MPGGVTESGNPAGLGTIKVFLVVALENTSLLLHHLVLFMSGLAKQFHFFYPVEALDAVVNIVKPIIVIICL